MRSTDAHAEAVERAHDALCDVCDALRQDERADPLPIARLLAQCAKLLGVACPWCGNCDDHCQACKEKPDAP